MSLIKPTTTSIIKKQYKYKLKSYVDVYFSLVVLQIISILFSFSPNSSMSGGNQIMSIDVSYYSVDVVIIFTMMWAFIMALLLTTKTYRHNDFGFVMNRVSSNISNVLFLLTTSIISGTTAMLSTFLQKVILYYIGGVDFVNDSSISGNPKQILLGIGATILYMLLFCALGYIVGTLVQLNKAFTFIIPATFFGILFTRNISSSLDFTTTELFNFFFKEPSFIFFSLKIIITVALLFTCSTVMSNKLEVRE